MGLDRAPIEFQTFYFFHVWLDPPNALPCAQYVKGSAELYENAGQLYEAAVKVELR